MIQHSIVVRVAFVFVIIGTFLASLGTSSALAQVSGAEAQVAFQQILDQTDGQPPIFGPGTYVLPFEAWEDCPICTWPIGLSVKDIRVHLELSWPDGGALPISLMTAVRQDDPQSLDVLDPNFFTIAPDYWVAGGTTGDLFKAPQSVDIIARGNTGYLGIDGELVTTVDMTGWTDAGDVVLTGAALVDVGSATLGLSEVNVWDLSGAQLPDTVPGASDAATKFDELRLAALTQQVLYGPNSGSMAHDITAVTFVDAGVAVSDFASRIECIAPSADPSIRWDCGFAFRDVFGGEHYRLGVISDGSWFLSAGSGDPIQSGDGIANIAQLPGEFSIDLVVEGNAGYFGVNGAFVAELNLGGIPGPGTVAAATSFFDSTYLPGAATGYENFIVISLESQAVTVPPVVQATTATYVDPDYGYSLSWDETWREVDPVTTGSTSFQLTNGTVLAEIYGLKADTDATGCIESLVAYYSGQPGYSNVNYVTDEAGDALFAEGSDVALALISFTITDDQGQATDHFDYALCGTLGDGNSLVRLEQYLEPDDYMYQLDAMNTLQAGLDFNPGGASTTPAQGSDVADSAGVNRGDASLLDEVITETNSAAPIFGPASGDLALDESGASLWASGVSAMDVRVHLEVVPPAPGTNWTLFIGIRSNQGPVTLTDLALDQESIVVFFDGFWTAAGQSGEVSEAITSLDLVADGNDGYLAINGKYVATLDMQLAIGPGDVVLGASQIGSGAPALGITNFTIWDIGTEFPEVAPESASNSMESDAQRFDQLMVDSRAYPIVFGPTEGSLPHDPDTITFVDSAVSVSDFAVHVECLPPLTAGVAAWDCGVEFRDVVAGDHYRLGVASDGTWFLSIGANNSIRSGSGLLLPSNAAAGINIDLIVEGTAGYLGVNGEYVDTLDLSDIPGPGTVAVATSFYLGTFVEGDVTSYRNLTIWSMDSIEAAPAGQAGVVGNSYVSPSFGYSLTWDETWGVNNESSEGGADHLSITNGRVTAVLFGFGGGAPTATECFEDLMNGYLQNPEYSNVDFVRDLYGNPMMTPGDSIASALITLTITQEGGPPVELWDYAMCVRDAEKQSIVHLEQLVSPGEFRSQRQAMEQLQGGLSLTGVKTVSPPGLPELSGVLSLPTDEDVSNFTQLSDIPGSRQPDAGPAAASLTLDQAAGNTWSAGLTATDVWIRVELANPPSATSNEWALQIDFRSAGFGSDTFLILANGDWRGNQTTGSFGSLPQTIDLVAVGGTAYIAFDGQLEAVFDVSTWMQPGDVVVYAGQMGDIVPGATLDIASVTVWDVEWKEPPAGATAITYYPEDAEAFPSILSHVLSTGQVVYGPASGTMAYSTGMVTFEQTDVQVSDFGARIVCLAPAVSTVWDCGFVFRDLSSEAQYRIGITSDGSWFLGSGVANPALSGSVSFPPLPPGTPVTLDLVVAGTEAFLGVNSQYVATLDIPEFPGPGTVAAASAFFDRTSVPEGIGFESFTVWSLDVTAEQVSAVTGVSGSSYTSPNYGYSLSWSDEWTVTDEYSEPGYDFLELTNGAVRADLYSVSGFGDATTCNEDLLDTYASDAAYSNVVYLVDALGNRLVEMGTETATAWFAFTYTDEQGNSTEFYDFAVCARLSEGATMVQLELQARPDDVNANLSAMEQLAMGLVLDPLDSDILDAKGGGPISGALEGVESSNESSVRAEPTPSQEGLILLEPVGASGVSGLVTITGNEDGVEMTAVVAGASAGDLVTLQAGTCQSLSGAPEYVAGALDENRTATATIAVGHDELTSTLDYAVVIYPGGFQQDSRPLACGDFDS